MAVINRSFKMNKICFNRWVGENNVDPKLNYGKGWWEYIEFVRRISEKLNATVFVVDTFQMGTPPPEEVLTMPVFLLETQNHDFYIKESFSYGGFFDQWLISVNCKSDGVTCDISKYINPLTKIEVQGFREGFIDDVKMGFTKNDLIFESYSENNKVKFTGTVEDELELFSLLNIICK
jgi:hypothetical protein